MDRPSERSQRVDLAALLGVTLTIAFAIRLFVARELPSLIWPDEIFQTLEQAHRLAFGVGIVPWEYRVGTRSWLLPGILAGIMKLTHPLGPGSSGYLFGVRAFLCAVSLLPVATAFFWGRRVGGRTFAFLAGMTLALWFELVYFAPKALFEVVAGNLLLPALYFARFDDGENRRLVLAGVLAGLALALRIHLAPALLVAALWLRHTRAVTRWSPVVIAAGVTFGAVGLLDAFTWDYPFQSVWNNVYVNIVEGKSSQFGTAPWFTYLATLPSVWSVATIPILVLVGLGSRRDGLGLLTALTVLASHSIIGHKEYRFLYPALPLIFLLVGLGLGELCRMIGLQTGRGWSSRLAVIALAGLTGLASLGIARDFDGTRTRSLYRRDPGTHWHSHRGPLVHFERLSRDDSACGVALYRVHWAVTGGYAHLHRDIPIYMLDDPAELLQRSPDFDRVLARGTRDADPGGGFSLVECIDAYCLYERPGGCRSRPDYSINDVISARRE